MESVIINMMTDIIDINDAKVISLMSGDCCYCEENNKRYICVNGRVIPYNLAIVYFIQFQNGFYDYTDTDTNKKLLAELNSFDSDDTVQYNKIYTTIKNIFKNAECVGNTIPKYF